MSPSFITYYHLAKPGIVYGNVMTTLAAFLFASHWHFGFGRLLATLIGTSLIIASACVLNNYIDRDIDAKMARTKRRALVMGTVSTQSAMLYAIGLGLLGFIILASFTNALTVVVGLLGSFFYVVVYGIAKRRSIYGTLVGSISGSMPIIAGYTAATGHFDRNALVLFLILAVWQLPHFYAIAMYRFDDYKAAGLPVWPVTKGMQSTKQQIIGYIIIYIFMTALLSLAGAAGAFFLIMASLAGLYWLWLGLNDFNSKDDVHWARRMFGTSLIVLLVFSAALSVGSVLP